MSSCRSGTDGFRPLVSVFSCSSVRPSWSPRPCSAEDSAPSVEASWSGRTAFSSGSRSSSTRSTSRADWLRSWSITSPAASVFVDGACGGTRDTNFSPNSVFGSSRAVTFDGICSIVAGFIDIRIVDTGPSVETCSTCPTIRPRTLTSARSWSWVPTRSTRSMTSSPALNTPA